MKHALRSLARTPGFTAIIVVTLALAGSGCSLTGGYDIADGSRKTRSYRSVAGEIRIGRGAIIHNAATVAGSIDVADGATTRSLSTTAGAIRIGESVKIEGGVSTVAGGIDIGRATHVTGTVATIAGEVELHGCRVDGPVKLTKGSLKVRGAAVLSGGLVVRHTSFGKDEDATEIDIGPGADIAFVEVEPGTEVDLRISREARVGKITGVTPTTY